MKRPAFMFYPADWRKDPELRVCSIAARGLWIDMMALMHEGEPYGHLVVNRVALSDEQLARLVGEPVKLVTKLLAELESHNVFSRNAEGVAFSRRMVADEHIRDVRAAAGKLGGNPNLLHKAGDNGVVGGKVKQTRKQKVTPSVALAVAVAVSPSEELSADAVNAADPFPKPDCDAAYERWIKLFGAIEYGRFRRVILPVYKAKEAEHPSLDQLRDAMQAFKDGRDGERPEFQGRYTLNHFAENLTHWVRLGGMPLVDTWGEATERGIAARIHA